VKREGEEERSEERRSEVERRGKKWREEIGEE
jgi:hypothetical protein